MKKSAMRILIRTAICASFLLFLAINVSAAALSIEGVGYGKTEAEAKKEALADLASVIKVRVYSKYEQSVTSSDGDALVRSNKFTRLTTDVPLLNPDITYIKKGGEVIATASVNDVRAYNIKLAEIAKKINEINDAAAKASSAEVRYRLLESVMPLYYEYDSYAAAPLILGVADIPAPKESATSVMNALLAMKAAPPSLEVAAEVLASPVTESRVYVAPILAAGSREVSPFAVFFGDILSAKLKGVKDLRDSNYIYNCTYSPSVGAITMACSLTSGTLTLKAAVVKIPQSLLTGIDYGIKTKNISSVLDEYIKPSENFSVQLKISSQGDPLLIREGEEFTVLVKVSKPSYIYLAGYSAGSANIIEMSRGKFSAYVNADDAGNWLSLGRFHAEEPFGTHTLQVFAVEADPAAAQFLPVYARGEFGNLPVPPEKAAEDLSSMFAAYKGVKASAYVTLTTLRTKP